MDGNDIGRRRSRRHGISVSGTYRTGEGTARAVELRDVSETGCCFIDRTKRLYVGTQLIVRVGNLGPFDGAVAWIDGAMVGLRFTRPLYAPLLDHLCGEYLAPAAELERRRSPRW